MTATRCFDKIPWVSHSYVQHLLEFHWDIIFELGAGEIPIALRACIHIYDVN